MVPMFFGPKNRNLNRVPRSSAARHPPPIRRTNSVLARGGAGGGPRQWAEFLFHLDPHP
jgi:hypothetical protein